MPGTPGLPFTSGYLSNRQQLGSNRGQDDNETAKTNLDKFKRTTGPFLSEENAHLGRRLP
jgi:hypothetical protein